MAKETSELRKLWKKFECNESAMVLVPFGPDRIRVAPQTGDAWSALAAVLAHHHYTIRTKDTDSYNCRNSKGGAGKSLHSYGIALDVNWGTNPYIDHQGTRAPRFSNKASQDERAEDQRLGHADTDMTRAMIDDVLKIATTKGVRVFEWGGNWQSVKDCMHFEIDVSPAELAEGIDWSTCAGAADLALAHPEHPVVPLQDEADRIAPVPSAAARTAEPHVVNARDGLKMRAGPGLHFGVVRSFPAGTIVHVLAREGEWAQVDLEGDGLADGYMFHGFLRQQDATAPAGPPAAPRASADALDRITLAIAKAMFPFTKTAAIESNLPQVLAGLRAVGLSDVDMGLIALATIRAETEGFRPIDEGQSRFNTQVRPFDRYDPGTSIGRTLGNTQAGDGARFRGRGYIQLTGRSNYTRIGRQIGVDLVNEPALANEPRTAGLILAQFLKNGESRLRGALASSNLREARRVVNGGSHGLDRFTDAFERGRAALRT